MERKLSGPNHSQWAADVKKQLERRGLWSLVDRESNTTSSETTAIAARLQENQASRAIVESLEPHVLRDLLISVAPSQLWRVVEERYRDFAFGSMMEKAFAYMDCRLDDETMSARGHVKRLGEDVEALESMGFSVPEHMQVMILLRSLRGSRYASIIKDARHLSSPPTLACIVDQLLSHDIITRSDSSFEQQQPEKPRKIEAEPTASLQCGSSWGSIGDTHLAASGTSAASSTSPEFTEEIMHAVARAIHSASIYRMESSAVGSAEGETRQAAVDRTPPLRKAAEAPDDKAAAES